MRKSALIMAVFSAANTIPVMASDTYDSAHRLSSRISLVSNYVLRGIEQTSSNPAVQGGMDYVHASGWYAGLWGSPVSRITDSGASDTAQYGSVSTEIDLYFGYKNNFATDYGYDIGFIRYSYQGNYTAAPGFALADSAELYAAARYRFLTIKYSCSILDQFMTVLDARGTNYIELNASYPIPETRYTLNAHIGRQTYTGTSADALEAMDRSPSYSDYRIGATAMVNSYELSVSFSNTNASTFYTYAQTLGGNWAGPVTVIALSHAF